MHMKCSEEFFLHVSPLYLLVNSTVFAILLGQWNNIILSTEMRFHISCFNTPDGLFQRWLTEKYKKVSYK